MSAREQPAVEPEQAREVWTRWLPLWHGLFYVLLLLCIALALFSDLPGAEPQDAAILLLSVLLAGWYGACIVRGTFLLRRPALLYGYLACGWALWLGLTLYDPAYLFLLAALYPQLFLFVAMPRAIVGGLALTVLWTARWAALDGRVVGLSLLIAVGVGAAAIALALFINAIIGQSMERARLLTALEAARHDLATAERQAGMLEERQRLASEIHDTLAQGLASIVTQLEAAEAAMRIDQARVQCHLDLARRTARESLSEARRVVWDLQPTPLAMAGAPLPRALATLTERWAEDTAIPVAIVVTGEPRPARPEVDAVALRSAREALANVRKHARARRVTVTLSYLGDRLALDVQDDGCGFDSATAPMRRADDGGFGLASLREHAARLGGALTVESAPGDGTTLAVTLPLTGGATAGPIAGATVCP